MTLGMRSYSSGDLRANELLSMQHTKFIPQALAIGMVVKQGTSLGPILKGTPTETHSSGHLSSDQPKRCVDFLGTNGADNKKTLVSTWV